MTHDNSPFSRRTALRTISGTALATIAGCLGTDDGGESSEGGNGASSGQNTLKRVTVEGTAVIVELTEAATVDQVNLIQPNGELFGKRPVAAGSQQVSFEIGTSYTPGEYHVLALKGEKTVVKTSLTIQPALEIQNIGLYRNNPNKPWDKVYGDTQTDRKKNGEAYVTVKNTGSGPNAAVQLQFSGDVPNPVENPQGSGIHKKEKVVVASGKTADLFSSSYPFGSVSEDGMGCSPKGNSGQFTILVETQVSDSPVTKTYDVQYSGSDDMTTCSVTITEV